MPRKPPFYTFQRSRKVSRPPLPISEERELYTPVETEANENSDDLTRYSRYIFYTLCIILLVLILLSAYLIRFGVPVRIRG